MIIKETYLKGAFTLEMDKISDDRGFFGRSWCSKELKSYGINTNIKQINTAFSRDKGTLRGAHYQCKPHEECKLIRCTKGEIFNFIVDLRPGSETFLKTFGIILSENNHVAVFSPEGFGQGYITLSNNCEITYFTSNLYAPGFDWGIRYNDPKIQIKLPIKPITISEKDKSWPDFDTKYLFIKP